MTPSIVDAVGRAAMFFASSRSVLDSCSFFDCPFSETESFRPSRFVITFL